MERGQRSTGERLSKSSKDKEGTKFKSNKSADKYGRSSLKNGPERRTRFKKLTTLNSVEDFAYEWVLKVMKCYYLKKYGITIEKVKDYKILPIADGGEFIRSDSFNSEQDENIEESGFHSTLSKSFSLSVEMDVPSSPPAIMAAMMHNLFVKVPLTKQAKFERIVRRNRTLNHEIQVYSGFMKDLQAFVKKRVGDNVVLNIPELYYGSTPLQEEDEDDPANDVGDVLVIEDLSRKGFTSRDWFKHKLNHKEVLAAVNELAKFHACGLAYRMSLNVDIERKYPYLDEDLYTSNMAKELLAKYLDSYLHFLSCLPGIQEHVLKLRKISSDVFQLLVKLRRPTDPLGTRFNTICHGDMWMGNVMYDENVDKCFLIDFHSCQYLSPATDLAHLLLTSTDRNYRKEHWDEVVEYYYDTFNRTLAEFGLILRHLGTTYNDFLYEVKRALRGQFLCVAFIIPIVIYCGPVEWRIERRRGSSVDRKNTVRHLIQMMAISEEATHSDESRRIPPEFAELYNDEPLRNTLIDLIHTAEDLDILDFQEFCKHINTPKPMWTKTQATTGKHIPVY